VEKAEHDFSAPPAGSDYALRAPQGQSRIEVMLSFSY